MKNKIYEESVDIPLLDEFPYLVQFHGDVHSVEVHINKIDFGLHKTKNMNEFILNFFLKMGKSNNLDISFTKERLEEINNKYKQEEQYLKMYYAEDLKYLYNVEKKIIKKVRDMLGLDYNQLGELIGVKGQSLRNMNSNGKITEQVEKAIHLLIENYNLKKELKDYTAFKEALKNITN